MKKSVNTIKLAVVAGAVLLKTAQMNAAEVGSNFYIEAAAGPSFVQGTTIHSSWAPGASGTANFNTGIRGDLLLGYKLNESLALEFQTGAIYNTIDNLSIGGFVVGSRYGSADAYQVPILANVVYTKAINEKLTAYVGAGLGGVDTTVNVSDELGNFSDSSFDFAYQAKTGVKYHLTQNATVGIGYEFLGTTGSSWTFGDVPINTDGVFTHAIMASFAWAF